MRLAPREELAAAARVAPLLRAARDLERWAGGRPELASAAELPDELSLAATADLDLAGRETAAAWQVVSALRRSGPVVATGDVGDLTSILASGPTEAVLEVWNEALDAVLAAEDLDGIATALYTVGGPVRMDGLFDAYAAAAGSLTSGSGLLAPADPRPGAPAGPRSGTPAGRQPGAPASPPPGSKARERALERAKEQGVVLSQALETLADLGVVELDTEESDGSLTVALSPLGIWGVHRRMRAQGWHVPVLAAAHDGAEALLATLASCDAEDGEAEIGSWLAARDPAAAAAELIDAAAKGSPGQRGAAFAVLDRIGPAAMAEVRAALGRPLLRAHAAVWLIEHGEDVPLAPQDQTWLLVDLGAGLLEEADPKDVVAELLPEIPPRDQAEIVSSLWQVSHPAVTVLLNALSEHHPDPEVARAARKAAFKAMSPAAAKRPAARAVRHPEA